MQNALPSHSWDRSYTDAVIMGSHVLYADTRLAALSLENHWAARYWSEGTRWCIESKSWFQDYRDSGKLVLFRLLENNRRYLLSPSLLEFRNARNRGLSMTAFIHRYPNIKPTIMSLAQNDWRALFYFDLVGENMRFDHSLNLRSLGISALPNRLSVRDDLVLSYNPIASLPVDLFVGGDLDIRDTKITKIPRTNHISGRVIAG